jgi:heptosyltransferase I
MKIAIVKLSALGDIVHAMIVLQFIKIFNREILIDWIVEEAYKDLLEYHPDINKVHIIKIKKAKKNKSLLVLFQELNNVRKLTPYDLVIDMQGLIKSALISRLIPSTTTLGFDKSSAREKFASIFYNKTFKCAYETNIINRNLALIEYSLGFSISDEQIHNKAPFLYSKRKKLSINTEGPKKNILLIPGASHDSKRYPAERFVEITKSIDAYFYIIWGSEEEESLARKIKGSASNITICERLQLDSLILLISKVDLVIGPDTGPTHIAWGLNVPSITLFGPTPGNRNIYETSLNKYIESKSKVNPNKINKNDFSIKDIDAQEIVIIASDLIK